MTDGVLRTNSQGQSFVMVHPVNSIIVPWGTLQSTPLEDIEAVRQAFSQGVEIPMGELRESLGLPPPDASHLITENNDDG